MILPAQLSVNYNSFSKNNHFIILKMITNLFAILY